MVSRKLLTRSWPHLCVDPDRIQPPTSKVEAHGRAGMGGSMQPPGGATDASTDGPPLPGPSVQSDRAFQPS